MEQISLYLDKFKTLGSNSSQITKVFVEVVEKILKVKIPTKDVVIREETIYIKAHPTLKSEFYLKRDVILSEISKKINKTDITNIR